MSRAAEPQISQMTQIGCRRTGAATRERDDGARIREALATLEAAYRDEIWHWMPDVARPIDVIVGAILVQHTTWTNAERALESLRDGRRTRSARARIDAGR